METDEISLDGDCAPAVETVKHVCTICLKDILNEPKIRCAECTDECILCLQCFSYGLETRKHVCGHSYHIDRRHIPRHATEWSLTEDKELLQAVFECGFGNEVDICRRFLHRNIEEVRIRVHELLGLDKAPLRCPIDDPNKPLIPYNCDGLRENPPRYPSKGVYAKYLAGYNAARADFKYEYDNNAESAIAALTVSSDEEDSDEELTRDLNIAIVESHNELLRERARRYAIVKEHALLLRKTSRMLNSTPYVKLHVFLQLLNRFDFDSLTVGLSLEEERTKKWFHLRRYRKLGVTRLRSCALYDRLEQMRVDDSKEFLPAMQIPRAIQGTKIHKSLEIESYSGYQSLSGEERELCASARIFPELFLKAKKLFIQVSQNEGGLKLKTARQLMKIDVNKTRKIYNFLRDKSLIKEILYSKIDSKQSEQSDNQ